MNKWEYDSTWERIITHDEDGRQRVVTNLISDPDWLRKMGPVIVNKLNELRGANGKT